MVEGASRPRVGTPRTSGSASLGPVLAQVCSLAGIELLPWQHHAAGVALELTGDGGWARRGVCIITARQNGRTELLKARILTQLFAPQLAHEQLLLHTAQDRTVPRTTFEEVVDVIADTPSFARRIPAHGIRESNGQERITTVDGRTYRILAPRQAAFRKWSADVLLFDEGREVPPEVFGAAIPTQRTRPNPQWWLVSSAGDGDSTLLANLSARGRQAAADPDSDPRMCYLEWSAPDGCALDDRQAWSAANPALGHLVTVDTIRDELADLTEEQFRVEILSQWPDAAGTPAVPPTSWAACAGAVETFDPDDDVATWLAVGVDGDGRDAALVAAAWIDDGRLAVQRVESWSDPAAIDMVAVGDRVGDWVDMWGPVSVAFDPTTAGPVVARLDDTTDTVRVVGRAATAASAMLWDAVVSGRLVHPADPVLDAQVSAAGRRKMPGGGWRIDRRDSAGPIPAVQALAAVVGEAFKRQPPEPDWVAY